jgi:hypothetical protein
VTDKLLVVVVHLMCTTTNTSSATGTKRRRPNGSSLREDAPVEVVDGAILNLHAPGHNALHVFVEGQPQVTTTHTLVIPLQHSVEWHDASLQVRTVTVLTYLLQCAKRVLIITHRKR